MPKICLDFSRKFAVKYLFTHYFCICWDDLIGEGRKKANRILLHIFQQPTAHQFRAG
jgi:hypothetical protein